MAHAAAALSTIVLVGGSTIPEPVSRLGLDVDDVIESVLAEDGVAPVIVRLREQADVGELLGVAQAAVDTVTATVTAATTDLEGLIAALSAPVHDTLVSTLDGTLGDVRGNPEIPEAGLGDDALDAVLGGALSGLLGGTLAGAVDGVTGTAEIVTGSTGTVAEPPRGSALVPTSVLGSTLNDLLGGAVDVEFIRALGGSLDETLDEFAKIARATAVVDLLHAVVADSTGELAGVLAAGSEAGTVSDVEEFWIFNGFSATVDEDAWVALAEHPAVASIDLDDEITLSDTATTLAGAANPVSLLASFGLLAPTQHVNWGIDAVGAARVWDEYGVRGEGVVVGIMDSGVDGQHPALAGSWRGRTGDPAKSWYVSTGEPYSRPGDGRGHGTHIAGIIVGEQDGYTTGIAPGAKWIAAKIFNDSGRTTVSAIHRGFEWMLAPGGDPAAAPDVVNNSWGTGYANNDEFWRDVDAWIAAGIVPVFATGNRGPRWGTVSSPGSYPQVIAVGASDAFDRVASFSSRGPVDWGQQRHIKPDVVAPGYRIRSTWTTSRGGGYRLMTGTSMAAPHAVGVIALMRSAEPDASVNELRNALVRSARPGQARTALPDNAFGHGIINAPGALKRITN